MAMKLKVLPLQQRIVMFTKRDGGILIFDVREAEPLLLWGVNNSPNP